MGAGWAMTGRPGPRRRAQGEGVRTSSLKISHLTDLHVRRDYRGTMFETTYDMAISPTAYLELGLRRAVRERPDVLVLTGDLIHEGTSEDYEFLRALIEREMPGVPVIPVLGNHDNKAEFYRGWRGEDREGRFNDVAEVGGYRFVVLDTSTEGEADGSIDADQAAWLFDELKTPAENGTILLGHHPFRSEQAWFACNLPEGFLDRIRRSDVIAYLCGHAHYLEARSMGWFMQVTGESFDYGVETLVSRTEVVWTETRAFNTCWVEGRDIATHAHFLFPFDPVIATFPLSQA